MSPLLVKVCKDFATIWTTIDPIGNVAIFAGLTASLTRAERRRTALRASVYAAVLLVTYIFLRFSDIILRVIGQQGAAVLVRVMGIILASLAVEIVLTALAVGSWGPAQALSQ